MICRDKSKKNKLKKEEEEEMHSHNGFQIQKNDGKQMRFFRFSLLANSKKKIELLFIHFLIPNFSMLCFVST